MLRTARSITRTVSRRRDCLSGYRVGLFQIHAPIAFATRRSEMNAMADLVESDQIRSVGISNYSAKQMRRAHDALLRRGLSLASNQVRYSLVDRSIETNGVLDAVRQLEMTIIAWSPLHMGLLSGRFHKNPALLERVPRLRRFQLRRKLYSSAELIDALEDIAHAHDATAAQVALSWLVHFHGGTVVAIPGASTVAQAAENAGAMALALSDGERSRIDELSLRFR